MFHDVLTWLSTLPRWQMFMGFWVIAVVRGLGYYVAGALVGSRLHGGRWSQARERVRDLGVRSVALTWPVYGLAGATQVVNGAVRVPLLSFLAVLTPLGALWAVLQTVLGVVLIEALMTRAAPWLLAVIVLVASARLLLHRRRLATQVGEAGA